jgi:hypothetical protein
VSLKSSIATSLGSPQQEWLTADIASSSAACTLAIWHHPLSSSATNGRHYQTMEIWRLLNQVDGQTHRDWGTASCVGPAAQYIRTPGAPID